MSTYKALNNQIFSSGDYSLVPIRKDDRFAIMQWRNEQLYHLRQAEPLTREQQDRYFNTVVASLFEQDKPEQILFSFLENKECVGYGGLVHINWTDRNAEISFVMDTSLEKNHFQEYWSVYLGLIEKVAFGELNLHKLYTWAFDLRPHLYEALEANGFEKEARLRDHCLIERKFYDVVVHRKCTSNFLFLRRAGLHDMKRLFEWANDEAVRKYSFSPNTILWKDHKKWFSGKINSDKSKIYILTNSAQQLGQIRIDLENDYWKIDYSIDNNHRGKGLGRKIIELLLASDGDKRLQAIVVKENIPSIRVFESLGFQKKTVNVGGVECFIFEYN